MESMDALQRHAIMECVAYIEGAILYENLMQSQEIPQKAMSHLRW